MQQPARICQMKNVKNTQNADALKKLNAQAERLVMQLKFLASSAEAAYTMTEDELDGLALSLGHALDDAEALHNTIDLLQDGPKRNIVPYPATFAKSNGNGMQVAAAQPA